MSGILIEFFWGVYFLGTGIDQKPNWFKVGIGAGLIIVAVMGFSPIR